MKKELLISLFFGLVVFLTPQLHAEEQAQNKARMLVWVLSNIEWQSVPTNNKLNMCSFAASPYSANQYLANYQFVMSPPYFVDFYSFDNQQALINFDIEHSCQIYYFDQTTSGLHIDKILSRVNERGLLTIGHGEKFLTQNGSLALISNGQTLQLKINNRQTSQQFTISPLHSMPIKF
ncbi:YfiR family protein [Catenovulum agarivorans]|uniref:YfiR family protein n=1 Tax=Catenovulum agarivorans TaxID=1172192 RepID=UPI000318DAA9|nr:YfiR family protein [Catenovulum agarivorans]